MQWARLITNNWWLAAVLMASAACVSPPSRLIGSSAAADASALHSWTAVGKIGVSGAQGGSGSFTWAQDGATASLQLRGPLGSGALQIEINDAQLTLRASDGSEYDAAAALAELESRIGVAVPVMQLRFWLRGLAAPGEHRWLGAGHHLLQQNEWQIAYDDWQQRAAMQLPGKLILTRDSLRMVLLVQRWQLR